MKKKKGLEKQHHGAALREEQNVDSSLRKASKSKVKWHKEIMTQVTRLSAES